MMNTMRVALFSLAFLAAMPPAWAADLARQSRLGEVFVERPARVLIHGYAETQQEPRDGFPLRLAPRTPGYYGRQTDYDYRSYYGTAPEAIFTRLPYACGSLGLC